MVTTRGSNFDANTCCRRVSIQCNSTGRLGREVRHRDGAPIYQLFPQKVCIPTEIVSWETTRKERITLTDRLPMRVTTRDAGKFAGQKIEHRIALEVEVGERIEAMKPSFLRTNEPRLPSSETFWCATNATGILEKAPTEPEYRT